MNNSTLVVCINCNRNNGMQRTTCIYCGFNLPITEYNKPSQTLTSLNRAEEEQSGFNIILLPSKILTNTNIFQKVETILQISLEQFEQICLAQSPIPIARISTENEAALLQQYLQKLGFESLVISDIEFCLKTVPLRLRRIQKHDQGMTFWTDEQTKTEILNVHKIKMIFLGKIRYKQMHITEINKSYGRGRELNDVIEYIEDTNVIDIIGTNLQQHFRIFATSFDYTCLENKMKLLAVENFKQLEQWITEQIPGISLDKEFENLAELLELAWPSSQLTINRHPLKRIGVGKLASKSNVILSNEFQLTRYVRMKYLLSNKVNALTKEDS